MSGKAARLQRRRLATRLAFFALFVLAPPLDLFRLDLTRGHFVLFGWDWTLGLEPFLRGEIGAGEVTVNLLLRGLLPIVLVVGVFFWVSWRWGRLYCGWLCPHFSVVELINGLMRRAGGRPSLWEREPLPQERPDGTRERRDRRWWWAVWPAVGGFAFLWALVLLTYLMPPAEIYGGLLRGGLGRYETVFLAAATAVFTIEFALARHLFCRYGCAVGLFQSYVWMANRRAMVVGYDRTRAEACADCLGHCEHVCPMRLKPRAIKRRMFACVQCARCIQACDETRARHGDEGLLTWVRDACALDVSWRDIGRPYVCTAPDCFLRHRDRLHGRAATWKNPSVSSGTG
ncbi:4Fe-4S binding protein [Inmirania thermothiophila]|uniref:4Fe-4S binding protein n=1 Tax=Inmirania thermothiophila TaxID=1750597 RepID=A0A3N1XS55_9GAMM|nr:4Fe-4S binding protein [Inmirania thermothiophila]ROR29493.1 4Fe-4S binding protein [Inmirania thermothiophila]